MRNVTGNSVRIPASRTVTLLTVLSCLGQQVYGDLTASTDPPGIGIQLVRSALQMELEGDNDYRELTLKTALKQDAGCSEARWHLGEIQTGDGWMPVGDAMANNGGNETLAAYAEKREQLNGSAAAEAELARWADEQRLPDRARLHWHRVAANPGAKRRDRRAATKALKLQEVNGVMLDERQREQLTAQQERLAAAFKLWQKPTERWGKALMSDRGRAREEALEELHGVSDPSAVLSLEANLSPLSPVIAAEVVNVLQSIPGFQATESLARHALLTAWPPVAQQATTALRSRPKHEYVPMLLNNLQSPVTTSFRVVSNSRQTRIERVAFAQGIDSNFLEYRTTRMRGSRGGLANAAIAQARAQRIAQRENDQVDRYNATVEERNNWVYSILEEATGEQLARKPAEWWDWWHEYNDVYAPRQTEVDFRIVDYAYSADLDGDSQVENYYGPVEPPPQRHECFQAGTPVWTETGLRAIETIEPGDRVLAQDQDTGELAFKLVLQRTRREPQPLVRVEVAGERLVSTKGHPFWINGTGWKMAKLVRPDDRVHTITGAASVSAVSEIPAPEEVYNLVVDGFGNYFVGEVGALVHDNTYRQATTRVVPGLALAD